MEPYVGHLLRDWERRNGDCNLCVRCGIPIVDKITLCEDCENE